MKGRRKVVTKKWHMLAQFEADARVLAGTMSANQKRFMQVATQIGRSDEPVGGMAGISNAEYSCE
jgi:hypothetical protein